MDKIKGYQSGEAPPPPPTDLKAKTKAEAPAKMEDLKKWEAALKDRQKKTDLGKSDSQSDQPGLDPDPAKRPDMQALRTLTNEMTADPHARLLPGRKDSDKDIPDQKNKDPSDTIGKDSLPPLDPGARVSDLSFAAPKPYFATPVPLKLLEYTDASRLSATLAGDRKAGVAGSGETGEVSQQNINKTESERKGLEHDAAIVGVGILQQMNQSAPTPFAPELAQTPPLPSQELQERVERMTQRLMVTDPSHGQKPEIILQLDSKYLNGAELALRMENNNQLVVTLRGGDPKAMASLENLQANLQRDVEGALTHGLPNLRVRVDLQLRPPG
jgi:hypothetical protein